MTSTTPLHHAQMLRTLPAWSKQLPAKHAGSILQRLRKAYLDPDGRPYQWYANGSEPDQLALRTAIDAAAASHRALQQELSLLQGISTFCTPLLEQQLRLQVPVTQAQYRYQASEVQLPIDGSPYNPGAQPPTGLLPVIPKGSPQLRSLLEAALHNFEGIADTTRFTRL